MTFCPQPKPARGTSVLQREAQRAAMVARQRTVIAEAKARDSWRCRWPEAHRCRGGLEGCHLDAKGMGGDHGIRTVTSNVISLCAWIHRRGPESLHGGQLKVDTETPFGADQRCSFWRLGKDGWYLVARERSIGIVERTES